MDLVQITKKLKDEGVEAVGFSFLGDVLPQRYAALPYGVTLLCRLSQFVVDEIMNGEEPGPTYAYFHHYRTVNAFLDREALWVASMLQRAGARALPVAASQSVGDMGPYSGIFPHKTGAVRAGLGWIGRNALLVTPQYGPRVRLATVLTDFPLPISEPQPMPGCGDCQECVAACPAAALTGETFQPGRPRSSLLDAAACSAHMKRAYQQIGRGAVCGVCMAVCPYGRG
jgi:epoxyqueuosine reductase